jgi:hypothetical protein
MSAEPRLIRGLRSGRRLARSGATLAGALWLYGCGAPPPRAPNPTRPLDERRAIEIILQAFQDERDTPVRGRPITLQPGRKLEVDVAAQGRKYGVAYVTASEKTQLGAALPPRDPARGDALQLTSGVGQDAEAHVLVLHDTDYLQDDQVVERHEETTVTAELMLRRDVRDFLVLAHSRKWP